MNKWLALMLVLLMIPVFCFSEGTNPFSFNGFTFGMNTEELYKKAEEMSYVIADNGNVGAGGDPWKVCQRYNAFFFFKLMPSLQIDGLMIYSSDKVGSGFKNDALSMEDYNYIRRALTALYGEENPNLSEWGAGYWARIYPGQSWTEGKGLLWEKRNVSIFLWQGDVDGDGQMDILINYVSPLALLVAASECPPEERNADWINVVPSWYAPLEETSEPVDTTGL